MLQACGGLGLEQTGGLSMASKLSLSDLSSSLLCFHVDALGTYSAFLVSPLGSAALSWSGPSDYKHFGGFELESMAPWVNALIH
uniref:Uncharacterized protein n=1 Tax=Pyxicephalus adspersus TaxID=30357 RepID=A0AAV2ZUD8_PYXAD|nr:TPA: hypothetical protein GDO54_013152 [Pyxicephalus adspersus]